MDEGGQTDTTSKIAHRNPLKARFLKVTNLRAMESSYQCMLALSGTPKGGWDEDLDWVGTLDELGVNADWVFRVQSISGREAKRRNSRIERTSPTRWTSRRARPRSPARAARWTSQPAT